MGHVDERQIFNAVISELCDLGIVSDGHTPLSMETSLVELGVDSLSVMELVGAVERTFNMGELDVQAWLDAESEDGQARYTVGSLVKRFAALEPV